MGTTRTVIHCNKRLDHQVLIARALQRGFQLHGVNSDISDKPDTRAETHVCLGPWFAFEQWRYHNTLYIDRAYWGDPEHISVTWLRKGEKLFYLPDYDRPYPELQPMKSGDRRIYLCDYQDKSRPVNMTVRLHPSQHPEKETLEEALSRHDIAVGRRSTAMIDASIAGLQVETYDSNSLIYPIANGKSRESWFPVLAWHNWSLKEIERGEMWDVIGRDNKTDEVSCHAG